MIRIGYFDIADAQITSNANNVAFLDSHFFEFGNGAIGDGTDADGTFTKASDNTSSNFPGQLARIWIFSAPTLGGALQQGIFDAPSNPAWIFPALEPPPSVTSVDLSDSGVVAVVGSLGGAVIIPGNPFSPFDSTAVLATITAGPSSTNDVLQYAALKGQSFDQASGSSPAASTNNPFEFFSFVDAVSSGAVKSAKVQDPGAVSRTLTNNLASLRFQFSKTFTNKTLLDTTFTNGTYNFTITTAHGTNTPSVTLPGDNYPSAPHISNWSTLQSVDSSSSFTVTWDAFTGGTSNDFIQLSIDDNAGSNVFATSSEFLDPAHLNGTNTSVIVPTNTLAAGQTYRAELMFVKVTSLDTNTISSAAGVGGFFAATDFGIATPSAGTFSFSASTFSVNEASGVATITVVRAGNTTGTVAVAFATGNGTAIAPGDFTVTTGQVTFSSLQTNATITVPIIDDTNVEAVETINLTLSTPTGGAAIGSPSHAVLTIIDNDSTMGATRIDFLQTELDDVFECLANVSLELLSSNRATAAADIADCVAALDQLIADTMAMATSDALTEKGAAKLLKQFEGLKKKLLAAQATLEDMTQADAKALKSLIKISAAMAKAQKGFIKFKTQAPFVVLEELKGKGGFHGTNEMVCYRIHILDSANGANCGPGTITVTNLDASVGLDVVQDGVIIRSATDFCVLTGADQGAARVTATACNRSSSLILINRGPPP